MGYISFLVSLVNMLNVTFLNFSHHFLLLFIFPTSGLPFLSIVECLVGDLEGDSPAFQVVAFSQLALDLAIPALIPC